MRKVNIPSESALISRDRMIKAIQDLYECVQEIQEILDPPPPPETKLVCYYNIQDISSATTVLTNYGNAVSTMEVDGTVLDNVSTTYQFTSTGEHIIKYAFTNEDTIGGSGPLFNTIPTLTKVIIPDTFTTINAYAVLSCANLESVVIGNGITTIGKQAFTSCTSLASVIIGSSVTDIGMQAFAGCSSLPSVIIPESTTNISQEAFASCSSLVSVTVEASAPPTLGVSVFNSNASGRKIYVPAASVATYKAASGWSTYASDIEAIP